jgi:para-nitrobenzyl esterase
MVHLHPGGNFFGRAYRNADWLVERGVIVVTVGYRLGALGFADHPALTEEGGGSSGEYGVSDQIAALDWVQDNIAGFGGDPGNVTLFGASAGSFDAVAIAASPGYDGGLLLFVDDGQLSGLEYWWVTEERPDVMPPLSAVGTPITSK